jgi:hypothetical protein
MLPVVVLGALFAGLWQGSWIESGGRRRSAGIAIVALVFGYTAFFTVSTTARLSHDTRIEAARWLDRTLGHTVMKVIGWEQDAMLRRYNVQTESDLRDAAAQVGAAKVSGTEPRDKGTVTPISKNLPLSHPECPR